MFAPIVDFHNEHEPSCYLGGETELHRTVQHEHNTVRLDKIQALEHERVYGFYIGRRRNGLDKSGNFPIPSRKCHLIGADYYES